MAERIVLLGAEKQAATSAALAYPERQFRFVSDQPVLDGWDLPNVTFTQGTPGNVALEKGEEAIALCPRWLPVDQQRPLSEVMPVLYDAFPGMILPVSYSPFPGQPCIVKGDRWHRPDSTITGANLDPADVGDPYGCGTVYQPHWPAEQHLIVVGHKFGSGGPAAGGFRIHSESCARDDVLAAGETIDDEILHPTFAALIRLQHRGFFTFNWLKRGNEYRLTSFRPAPRAVFGTFRNANINLLAPTGLAIAPPGYKFVVDITYTSYRRLVA
ncbi:MAG TPA: hypothetical protein VHR66_01005 [Gemmataceae bacterium]|nr:hypothetical protein [Gemmataceae bacterium]